MSLSFKTLILFVLGVTAQNYLSAQEKFDIKFGKVSAEDFNLSKYNFDTAAGAVYIADKGNSEFDGDNDGFRLIFRRQVRIKILNKNGFDAANFLIPVLRTHYGDHKLEKLSASTYNLEDGKVKQTKLDEKSVFTDNITKNLAHKKFTLPAVKEGSIIEVAYTIHTRYIYTLYPWDFQGQYPRIWSEYQAVIPGFFDYIFLKTGDHDFHISTQDVGKRNYVIMNNEAGTVADKMITIESPALIARWVMKDVPAMAEESYITSMDNYVSGISFQFSEYREPFTPRKVMTTWNEFSSNLLKSADFGVPLSDYNDWMNDDLKSITSGFSDPLARTKKIFEHVRDNFNCTAYGLGLTNSLKNVYKTRTGNVGDINLLLIAMLQQQGLAAQPLILSTRNHGIVNADYPIEASFNYVIAAVDIAGKRWFLDATEPGLAFGRLPLSCYNGHARIVNVKSPEAVYFNTDTLRETKITSVILGIDNSGKLAGTYGSKPGYYESLNIRRQLSKAGMDQGKLLESFKKTYPQGIVLSSLEIDSLKNYDQPVQVRYNIDGEGFNADLVYINPMLADGYTTNPFKSAERLYPVEMPYLKDEMYIFSIDIPAGYEVDELPESVKVNLNKDDGFFEYLISKSTSTVSLRSRIRLNRANFSPSEYEVLRNFFAQIVKKHGEQIVFKKKKESTPNP